MYYPMFPKLYPAPLLMSFALATTIAAIPIIKTPYDPHNCCISCGYTWCDTLLECIRTWETECPELINPFDKV